MKSISPRHLKNAPIQEAIVDLRVIIKNSPGKEQFDRLASGLAGTYSEPQPIFRYLSKLVMAEGSQTSTHNSAFAGYRLDGKENGLIFQAQTNGFTLSKLAPYSNWESLIAEARRLWPIFSSALEVQSVVRVACRYINRFQIPSQHFALREFIVKPPEIPQELPQGIGRFMLQMEIPIVDTGSTVLLTQALDSVPGQGPLVLLDIDAFRLTSHEVAEEKWWSELELLRELKNRFFFGSLTPKTLEMFE